MNPSSHSRLIVLALAWPLWGCVVVVSGLEYYKNHDNEQRTSYTGTVLERDTGKPVAGAVVLLTWSVGHPEVTGLIPIPLGHGVPYIKSGGGYDTYHAALGITNTRGEFLIDDPKPRYRSKNGKQDFVQGRIYKSDMIWIDMGYPNKDLEWIPETKKRWLHERDLELTRNGRDFDALPGAYQRFIPMLPHDSGILRVKRLDPSRESPFLALPYAISHESLSAWLATYENKEAGLKALKPLLLEIQKVLMSDWFKKASTSGTFYVDGKYYGALKSDGSGYWPVQPLHESYWKDEEINDFVEREWALAHQ